MQPLVERVDRFVRWFVNASPQAPLPGTSPASSIASEGRVERRTRHAAYGGIERRMRAGATRTSPGTR